MARMMEPPVGPDSAPFWEATRESRLLVQWCTACDRGIFYPRAFCPYCASGRGGTGGTGRVGEHLEWREASGHATVHSFTVEHNPAATGTTFSDAQPYVVALVDLDEGIRMLTNIVGGDPADVRIGQAVTLTWEPLTDGRQLPQFSTTSTPAPEPG
jgi:uncharacterized protein